MKRPATREGVVEVRGEHSGIRVQDRLVNSGPIVVVPPLLPVFAVISERMLGSSAQGKRLVAAS
ncbi:hypothetical protein [Streptomyces sp. 2A115]|uniref:hypothetical protein n=1 Tax=Streptomyces sp. 2A115 TaxID=3457439 RepID=UPI003FD50530